MSYRHDLLRLGYFIVASLLYALLIWALLSGVWYGHWAFDDTRALIGVVVGQLPLLVQKALELAPSRRVSDYSASNGKDSTSGSAPGAGGGKAPPAA